MAQAEAGLELPIGLTEQKFLQQLARIEARAVRSAQRQQKAFVDSNQQITRSFGQMSGQARGQIQNVSFQLQDLFVQIGAGTSATQALGQQLPQLLGGFGALGAVFGTVAAFAIPLAGAFLASGEGAKSLDDAVSDLTSAISDYESAVEAANVPTGVLIEKYGLAAGAARGLLEQLAQMARLDAGAAVAAGATAIDDAFQGVGRTLFALDLQLAEFGPGTAEVAAIVDTLKQEFGLTVDQARQLQQLIADGQAASSLEDQVAAMQRLAAFLNEAAGQAGFANQQLNEAAKAANEATLEGLRFKNMLNDGAVSAGDLASLIASIDFTNPIEGARALSGAMGVIVGQAQTVLDRLGAAAKAARQRIQSQVAGGNTLDPLGAFNGGQASASQVQINAGGTIRTPELPPIPSASSGSGARRGGGGRRASGGRSSGSGSEDAPLFDRAERDIEQLQREISLIGKSNQEVATAKARWEALDEAKRRGVPVNAEMSAQIDAQAEQFGHLTAELERAEASQQQFEQAVDGIADAMAGALVAGESLRDGLAQVLKSIASDIINSGIRQALMGQFGGGGGFGGFLSGIFGGGDPLTSALRVAGLPARAMGGPVSANQPYLVGERGPEIVVPGRSGTVIPNHRIGSGGGQSVLVVELSPEVKAQILAEAEGQSVRISQQTAAAQAKALPGQVQRINAQPRRRP
ncbi:hypothetical protein [Paracoccus sp. ME4]|uniref:hypothetical protein n=1 Tax=Paracoccus sp. ME4 TaxID=3138066 RepID=UPI00398B7440